MYQHITIVDKYDPISGLYYKSISDEEKKAMFSKISGSKHTSNIAIFNPKDETFTMLFTEKEDVHINLFLFEIGYDEKCMQVEFEGNYSHIVRNNKEIEKREMKDKLLIGLAKGEGLKLLTVVSKGSSWHIDVKNSKLRVIDVSDNSFKIKNFDW